MFGHQEWLRMKSDSEDPDLTRPGGFERQVRGRIMGSLLLVVWLVLAIGILQLT